MPAVYDVDWAAETAMTSAIQCLIRALNDSGWLDSQPPSEDAFQSRFAQLQDCEVTATAFTPAMCRLFYELGYAIAPRHPLGIGTYCGTAMNLLVAGAKDRNDRGLKAFGIDLDPSVNRIARGNAIKMQVDDCLRYFDGDGLDYFSNPRNNRCPIDLLYLDFDDPVTGKAGYAEAFQKARPYMAPNAFLLAHDALVPKFHTDLELLRAQVKSSGDFELLLDIPIDRAGLFLAARRT
jgi:predicted O-methyltransferase YrrM